MFIFHGNGTLLICESSVLYTVVGMNRSKSRIILVDENKEVVSILAGTFGLKAIAFPV
jgi:hypothetical protein